MEGVITLMANDSILSTVKNSIGITDDYTHFDNDIIMHINTVLSTLYQLGIGPIGGYQINDGNDTWDDFLSGDPRINFVKTYICLRVRMLFDPPTAGPVIDAYNRQIDELTWRINVAVDPDEG